MAFTVDDFQDLIRLLGQHPEWRAELLELPALMRQLTERVAALVAAQARTEARVDELVEVQRDMQSQFKSLNDRMGNTSGKMLELHYARRAPGYFGRWARRVRVLEPGPLSDLLGDAVVADQLTDDERNVIMDAELVLSGIRREDQAEIYWLAEISAGVGAYDVQRAVEPARLLEKLGRPVIAVVAGDRIDPEPDALARAAGVWRIVDGHVLPPDRPANA